MELCTQRVRQAGYIKFLCGLCVCEGQGILSNQTVICKRLLEENPQMLLVMDVVDSAVIVTVPADEDIRRYSAASHGGLLPSKVHKTRHKQRKSVVGLGAL